MIGACALHARVPRCARGGAVNAARSTHLEVELGELKKRKNDEANEIHRAAPDLCEECSEVEHARKRGADSPEEQPSALCDGVLAANLAERGKQRQHKGDKKVREPDPAPKAEKVEDNRRNEREHHHDDVEPREARRSGSTSNDACAARGERSEERGMT